MSKIFLLFELGWCFFQIKPALAQTSISAEGALGFTSNATLTADPVSDFFYRMGATARIPTGDFSNRISIRYANYFTQSENDLFSVDLSTGWTSAAKSDPTNYELVLSLRDYVRTDLGTVDYGFTHYGVIGSMSWSPWKTSSVAWTLSPQAEIQYYPSFSSRTDFSPSFEIEADFSQNHGDEILTAGLTPGLELSTMGDFSKVNLTLAGEYEHPLDDLTSWGLATDFVLSAYTSRIGSSTVLSTRRGRVSTVVSDKESTMLFSPSVFWSKYLEKALEFRAELYGNFQNSHSGIFNFSELSAVASVHWKI